jgi:hypothetical protein
MQFQKKLPKFNIEYGAWFFTKIKKEHQQIVKNDVEVILAEILNFQQTFKKFLQLRQYLKTNISHGKFREDDYHHCINSKTKIKFPPSLTKSG